MARRGSRADVDLFPFLSVLCAMIGVLVLFLLIIGTTRVQHAMADISNLPPPPPPPERTIEAGEGLDVQEYERLKQQVDELTTRLVERQQEHDRLKRLTNELADLIAAKQDVIAPAGGDGDYVEGISLEPREDVEMVQEANVHVTKNPHLVEISADEFVIHPEEERYPIADLKRQGSGLQKFLAGMDQRRDSEYLLLLIHPNGADAYGEVMEYVFKHFSDLTKNPPFRIDIGKEPFSPGWLLINKGRPQSTTSR